MVRMHRTSDDPAVVGSQYCGQGPSLTQCSWPVATSMAFCRQGNGLMKVCSGSGMGLVWQTSIHSAGTSSLLKERQKPTCQSPLSWGWYLQRPPSRANPTGQELLKEGTVSTHSCRPARVIVLVQSG